MLVLNETDRAILRDIQNGEDRIEMCFKYNVKLPYVNMLLRHIGLRPTARELRRHHLELFMKEFNELNGTDYKAKI